MYEKFFGLSEKPFQQIPDPDYFFESRVHKRARAYLDFGLHQAEGFIVITGEVGSGKTTLLRAALRRIAPGPYEIAQLVSTNLEHDELLRLIALEFSLDVRGGHKADLLVALRDWLLARHAEGRHVLLVIDEAQNLPASALEELRMLSNFDDGNQPLLQCLLVGQAELRTQLAASEMRRLRERIGAAYHLTGLDEADVGPYIAHRLQRAGGSADKPEFSAAACTALHAATQGIPRRLNMLCDRLLITAYLDELDTVGEAEVETALRELRAEFAHVDDTGDPAETGSAGASLPTSQASAVWAEQQVLEIENRITSLEQSNTEIRKGMSVLVREIRRLVESRRRERERARARALARQQQQQQTSDATSGR
jgi:putative secretion ATPase (PEP-CTERM system associated)